MSSDLKTTYQVLETIASKELGNYLDTLKQNALASIKEVDELIESLKPIIPSHAQRCEDLIHKVKGSIARFKAIASDKSHESSDRLVAREQLPKFHELHLTLTGLNADLASLSYYGTLDSIDLMLSRQLPLFHAYNIGTPSNQEKRAYVIRILRDAAGFISGIDKIMSLWSLMDTSREWIHHKTKLSDAIKRVQFLVGIAEIVRYMREEGLEEIRQVIESKRQELLGLGEIMTGYEEIYKKLVEDTNWLMQELRKDDEIQDN